MSEKRSEVGRPICPYDSTLLNPSNILHLYNPSPVMPPSAALRNSSTHSPKSPSNNGTTLITPAIKRSFSSRIAGKTSSSVRYCWNTPGQSDCAKTLLWAKSAVRRV
ncbi:hypothetical protein Tdes44962_MAKER08260 [Teratosphaeria destructans]|uniref:Uncharacterized protein n=1 Tax=Teratosphaeria destructans TaxID=418781 RepID=A0A9W7SX40_9PEZI|nr:hypothetical protein Tdes44962_MAKER08260 [Teratosphaeria destructans]